jgi:hypothetical protein
MVASELDIRSRDTKAEHPPLSITAPHRTALHGPAPHRSSPLRMASRLIARRCKIAHRKLGQWARGSATHCAAQHRLSPRKHQTHLTRRTARHRTASHRTIPRCTSHDTRARPTIQTWHSTQRSLLLTSGSFGLPLQGLCYKEHLQRWHSRIHAFPEKLQGVVSANPIKVPAEAILAPF